MITPFTDFTGQMSADEVKQTQLADITTALDNLKSQVTVLGSMNVAFYGDAVISNVFTPANAFNGTPDTYTVSNGVVATITHNLGYVPQFLGYLKLSNGTNLIYSKFPHFEYFYTGAPGTPTYQFDSYVMTADTAHLYLTFNCTGGSLGYSGLGVPTFKYYIFAQPQS